MALRLEVADDDPNLAHVLDEHLQLRFEVLERRTHFVYREGEGGQIVWVAGLGAHLLECGFRVYFKELQLRKQTVHYFISANNLRARKEDREEHEIKESKQVETNKCEW